MIDILLYIRFESVNPLNTINHASNLISIIGRIFYNLCQISHHKSKLIRVYSDDIGGSKHTNISV